MVLWNTSNIDMFLHPGQPGTQKDSPSQVCPVAGDTPSRETLKHLNLQIMKVQRLLRIQHPRKTSGFQGVRILLQEQ